MLYQNQPCELIGEKEVFGHKIAWIRLLENNTFIEVPFQELQQDEEVFHLPHIRYIALAAKIKDEVAKKNILAPYESSLVPLPHQILVLEKVMQAEQNRFMLADEVGMGKTIETGLILKELKLRGEIKRVLVIVPKSSMLQWQAELKEHFNEIFHIYDSEMITSLARTFSNINADEEFNFWRQHHQVIVSTDALKPLDRRQGWSQDRIDEYNRYRMDAVLNADFDLVIIDEAHKMGGANALVSRYVLAQELCNAVPNVLLLTATPHRGKADHFRRILQLLDPDAFAGDGLPEIRELEQYVIRTEKRNAVDYEGNKLFNERFTYKLDVLLDINKHIKQMALYDAVTQYVIKGFNTAKHSKNKATGLIMILFQRLVSSSTLAILSAMEKRLHRLQNNLLEVDSNWSEDFEASTEEELLDFDFEGIYFNGLDGLEDEESILEKLILQAKDCLATEIDAKAEALLKKFELLQQEKNDINLKILVFTEFRTTQKMLVDIFSKKGYQVTFINGSQDLDERKNALVSFKGEKQILIATDAAGESLNMQFCHIIFNYDLPWNPMMIEQRIGRVDRIGQKHPVQAYNLLTNNSVDLRVYEVIEEKLTNILEQFGIDKSSDVLDSTIDLKKVNNLYLQSLLNPDRFDFASDKWIHEIKNKLKEFKSTEGIIPLVQEEEIEYKKAAEVKNSPLPIWLENLYTTYAQMKGNSYTTTTLGYSVLDKGGQKNKITFDPEVALNNPDVEHITLQHNTIKSLLNQLTEFSIDKGIPALKSKDSDETSGYWSLWQVSAKNQLDQKLDYISCFVADNGKQYTAYANDIWSRLMMSNENFSFKNTVHLENWQEIQEKVNEVLYETFKKLEADLIENIDKKLKNKENAYNVQKRRIEKIGIENIKESKLKRLNLEHHYWLSKIKEYRNVIPGSKLLITIRIDGE
ncbi:helicase-related protein [Myroides odoratus]|uniref:DEAD/DEAH box helicase n=1 Tax=Myroides odoratus TaxID=256 RepID=UPI003342CC14